MYHVFFFFNRSWFHLLSARIETFSWIYILYIYSSADTCSIGMYVAWQLLKQTTRNYGSNVYSLISYCIFWCFIFPVVQFFYVCMYILCYVSMCVGNKHAECGSILIGCYWWTNCNVWCLTIAIGGWSSLRWIS